MPAWREQRPVVIGMVHLAPLAGAPAFAGNWAAVRDRALEDARVLLDCGLHGLMVENFGDAPFYPRQVPAHVVAQMTAIAADLRRLCPIPLGINVLRNDALAALAIAHAVGAEFIRVNVLCGARVTDQGLIEGTAHELMRERVALGATSVRVLADVDVKHSAPLAQRPLSDEVADLIERGRADGLIVSGSSTGKAVHRDDLQSVRKAAAGTPVFVGSGVTLDNAARLAAECDGMIVGTALKKDGRAENGVDASRVRALLERLEPSN